jgi:hypothetical protein
MKGEDPVIEFEEKVETLYYRYYYRFPEITRELIREVLRRYNGKVDDVKLARKYIRKYIKSNFTSTASGHADVMGSPRAENPEKHPVGHLEALFPGGQYVQELSHRRTEDPTQVYNMLEEILGHHQGLVSHFQTQVQESTSHMDPAEIAKIAKKLLSDNAPEIEGMFEQFDKQPSPRREELYFAFRCYMLVQGFCCICHDRLARAVKDFLISILIDYRATVDKRRVQNLTSLYENLSRNFDESFSSSRGTAATVSQSTCRLAGEKTIEIFREWLRTKYEIVLDDSVIIHMKTRIETTEIIANILSGAEINEDDKPLQVCVMRISSALFDAATNVTPGMSVGEFGTTSIDGAPLPKDAPLLAFQSCLFNPPQQMKKKMQRQAVDPTLVPTLVPRACLWDSRDDTKYDDTRKIIAPLSMGPVTVVSLLAFDPDIVNRAFMEIVKRNTKSPLWTPVVLMFGLADHFIVDDDTNAEANDFYNNKFEDFLSTVREEAKSEARRLNLSRECSGLETYVPQYVIINGQICILLSASFGSMSVNMTTNIIKPVIPQVLLGIRGVGGCSNKRLSGVVYIGQDADSTKLLDKAGNPTPLGKMVATTGLMIKQWGDESKIYLLLLIRFLTGWSLGMLCTVDKMAGTQYGLFGPTMVVGGGGITVSTPASSLRATEELLHLIADLQARFQLYADKLDDKDLHNDLKIKYDTFCKQALSETLLPAIQLLSSTERGDDISELPSLLSALVFCDVLSCRDSLVSKEKMRKIITTPFDRSIHGATSSDDDFPDLFLERNTSGCLVNCLGTFGSSLETHRKQWTYIGAEGEQVPECDFTHYVERTIELEIGRGCITRDAEIIFDRYKALINLEGGVFTLLNQRDNFKKKALMGAVQKRASRSSKSLYDYDKIITEVLDPMILTVLEKYIIENTTGNIGPNQSVSWRDMCLSNVKKWFNRVTKLKIFQDSIGLSQESDRADYIMGHKVVDVVDRGLDCSVSGSQQDDETLLSLSPPPPSKITKIQRTPLPLTVVVPTFNLPAVEAPAASAPAAPSVVTRRAAAAAAAASHDQFADLYSSGKKWLEKRLEKRNRDKTGGTRKKSKIQKRKITRKYKGKNSRHIHTIKNRHIRNYSLRNKQ